MVNASFGADEFGMLRCTLTDGKLIATIAAVNSQDAAADLLTALDRATAEGVAECFWPRAAGMYRWLLRRNQDRARVDVLWTAGTLTGWESLFWAECDWPSFEEQIRRQATPYAAAAAGG
jgi:hypothetical protein